MVQEIVYNRKRGDISTNESRNWPKGAKISSHEFMDVDKAMKGRNSRKFLTNEEVFKLSDDEVLAIIYPSIDLKNFIQNNLSMPSKCCRLIFLFGWKRICTIHRVHGEAIKFFNTTIVADVDLNIPADPKWGWDMTKPEEGFPCINLTENGCSYHSEHPNRCKNFPSSRQEVRSIPSCSYVWTEVDPGRWERSGSCNGCKK